MMKYFHRLQNFNQRSLLALANAYDLDVHHMDVTTAFLNGDLDCEIYMEQPEGFIDPDHPDYVCLLDKSLYGLKQSSRCWNNTLDSYLKENDYRQSLADECTGLSNTNAPIFRHNITDVWINFASISIHFLNPELNPSSAMDYVN